MPTSCSSAGCAGAKPRRWPSTIPTGCPSTPGPRATSSPSNADSGTHSPPRHLTGPTTLVHWSARAMLSRGARDARPSTGGASRSPSDLATASTRSRSRDPPRRIKESRSGPTTLHRGPRTRPGDLGHTDAGDVPHRPRARSPAARPTHRSAHRPSRTSGVPGAQRASQSPDSGRRRSSRRLRWDRSMDRCSNRHRALPARTRHHRQAQRPRPRTARSRRRVGVARRTAERRDDHRLAARGPARRPIARAGWTRPRFVNPNTRSGAAAGHPRGNVRSV